MADVSVSAATVLHSTGAKVEVTAGEAITIGQPVYKKTSDGRYYKTDSNVDAATAAAAGISLTQAAGAGQPLVIHKSGRIALGATLVLGEVYCVSTNAGGICPAADVTAGQYMTVLGVTPTTAYLDVNILESGVVSA